MKSEEARKVNLALQGGGAQGAFTWGVLDQLLLDERLEFEAISATSAGAMNATIMAYGLATGGRDEARKLLRIFWRRISQAASMLPLRPTMFDRWMGMHNVNLSPGFMAMDYMTRIFSPYQLNMLDINPLRNILKDMVKFETIREHDTLKLFINATNVRSGKIKIFESSELTLDMVMASACLPFIFQTVEIDGEAYWDGGYSGNPAIYPIIYKCNCSDVILVQINPINADEVPKSAPDILDRVNEISFNATLMREMRAIAFVHKLKEQNMLNDKDNSHYKNMHIHMIEAEDIIRGLGRSSKLNADWDFLCYMHDIGIQTASEWLEKNFSAIGERSSVDIHEVFL